MTTKKRQTVGLGRLANPFKEGKLRGQGKATKPREQQTTKLSRQSRDTTVASRQGVTTDTPVKLMKVSHALTLIYIALLLAFSIVAVQNNRIRKAHSELLAQHDALYVETQTLRLEAADITSPMAIRTWAKNQGMVPYYSSDMELEQLEPNYINPNYIDQEAPVLGLGN